MQPGPEGDRRQQMREAFLAAIQEAFERRAAAGSVAPPPRPARDIQLAATLLAVSVARADHKKVADEHRAIEHALRRCLGLTEDEMAMLYRRAEEAAGNGGPGLAELASTIASSMTPVQKKDVVRSL